MQSDRRYALKGVLLETPKALSRRKASTGSMLSKCDGMWQNNSAKTMRTRYAGGNSLVHGSFEVVDKPPGKRAFGGHRMP